LKGGKREEDKVRPLGERREGTRDRESEKKRLEKGEMK
jgi:hypothetical protein